MAEGPSSNEPKLVRPYIARPDPAEPESGSEGLEPDDPVDPPPERGVAERIAGRTAVPHRDEWTTTESDLGGFDLFVNADHEADDDGYAGPAHRRPRSPRRRLLLVAGAGAAAATAAIVIAAVAMSGVPAGDNLPGSPFAAGGGQAGAPAITAAAERTTVSPTASTSAGPSATGEPSATPTPTTAPAPVDPPPASARTGSVVGIGGLCLTADLSNRGNGNPVRIYGCGGRQGQTWTAATNGTMRSEDRCLRVGDGASPGASVQTWRCNGEPSQQWRFRADQTLVNPASGLCLESPGGSTQEGTQLKVATCTGTTRQRWEIVVA